MFADLPGFGQHAILAAVKEDFAMRYWLSFDLGFQGNYQDLFAWLDKMEARECGENAATFLSAKSRQTIVKELKAVLQVTERPSSSPTTEPRIYIITRKRGGKFVIGKRKIAPWAGYAKAVVESGEEK
jgi:hypothetical protein